jgi:hypothetical protein
MAGDDEMGGEMPDAATELIALRARNEALEHSLREARAASDRRAIQAELRAEAARRGMVDLDGLKLADLGDVTIDEEGVVHGAATLMTKLRRDKPWLFGAASSSSVAGAPAPAPNRAKMATEMTLGEWRSARAELLRRS